MFIVYVLTLYSSTFYSNTAKHNANVQYTVEIDSQLYSHCITGRDGFSGGVRGSAPPPQNI